MKHCITLLMLCFTANLAFADSTPLHAGVDTLTPVFILKKAQKTYAGIHNYIDSGSVTSGYYGDGEKHHQFIKPFKTAYAADGRYNFEYYEEGQAKSLYIIHRDRNGSVKTWSGFDEKIQFYPRLTDAISALSGVSANSSIRIPKLLLPEYSGAENILNLLQNPVLLGSELVNNSDCYKIGAMMYDRDTVKIWINKSNSLILKIEVYSPQDNLKSKNTYLYFPATPLNINDSEFLFKPRMIDIYAGMWHRTIYSRFGALNALLLLIGLGYLVKWISRNSTRSTISA